MTLLMPRTGTHCRIASNTAEAAAMACEGCLWRHLHDARVSRTCVRLVRCTKLPCYRQTLHGRLLLETQAACLFQWLQHLLQMRALPLLTQLCMYVFPPLPMSHDFPCAGPITCKCVWEGESMADPVAFVLPTDEEQATAIKLRALTLPCGYCCTYPHTTPCLQSACGHVVASLCRPHQHVIHPAPQQQHVAA